MEGWKKWSGTGDENWVFSKWHYLVPPGWKRQTTRKLAEICAFQYVQSNVAAWRDLRLHCQGRFIKVRHEDLVADPLGEYAKILGFCELRASGYLGHQLSRTRDRVFTTGGSAPYDGKWRDLHAAQIESVRGLIEPIDREHYQDHT